MNKVKVDFENCYGIKSLKYEFDFTEKSTYAIYAPNGVMKTSFAKSFMDLSNGNISKDEIFPERVTKRIIQDEVDTDIQSENIFVIEPYNQQYKSAKISTLLVNGELKEKYDLILNEIEKKKDDFIKAVKPLCGINRNIDEAYSEAFTHSKKEFFKSISRIKTDVDDDDYSHLNGIKYGQIFTPRVESLLEEPGFKEKLKAYTEKYDDLIGNSLYFRKGIFNHNNASIIAKNLKDNGFFDANHSVNLYDSTSTKRVSTVVELESVIKEEKEKILSNPELVSAFEEIDKKLKANQELRAFRKYLMNNLVILPELDNIPLFKQKLWIAYTQESKEAYQSLISIYEEGKKDLEEIVEKAKQEETLWKSVVSIFNTRFAVPFKLAVQNQEDVILRREGANIRFVFDDASSSVAVDEKNLMKVLSNGERRALYLLNIIFEIEARKNNSIETLFIIDDIADSFDYKNKYAIIEYLKDISLGINFKQIILSHNFDFFRTISSRLDIIRKNKLHSLKTPAEVKLIVERYQNNPFNHWKNKLESNNSMLIASIPFVRNIAEFSGDKDNFLKLTSLLHIKNDTASIKISDLEAIHKDILKDKSTLSLPNPTSKVVDLIYQEADRITGSIDEIIELEEKVVLAIAIRLKCEEYLIRKINDQAYVDGIQKNQTFVLCTKFKELFPDEKQVIKLIDQINLMTPENIHLNSFMYEPILDMANDHLKNLYTHVGQL